MLLSLHVKNLALIEETEVNFGPGLNILTGETGAGKSLLIGSINLALGGKFDPAMLRNGASSGLVELEFSCDGLAGEPIRACLEEMDLESAADEESIIISRKLQTGKSVFRINGETVTAKQVKNLSSLLLDLHGQHEHQSLLKKSKHLEILDAYCKEEGSELLAEVSKAYSVWHELQEKLETESRDTAALEREKSLAQFEYDEIMDAELVLGEDEELEKAYRKMSNSKKIMEGLGQSYGATSSDSSDGAGSQISYALRQLRTVSGYDEDLAGLEEQLQEIENLLSDYNREVYQYMADAEFDEQRFFETQERLNQINHLKEKYGASLEEVLAYAQERSQLLERLSDYDAYIEKLQKDIAGAQENLRNLCQKLTAVRKVGAEKLQVALTESLLNLNFLTVDFEVRISEKSQPGANGNDDVEFLISTNPGESRKPLGEVASGGELSRIMLGIKTLLAEKDLVDTLIFDEIDTGISGKTAWMVSKQMAQVAAVHQVICITHLPQIAAMADTHYVIEKKTENGITTTNVRALEKQESMGELARLLGSDDMGQAALANAALMNAAQMKEEADAFKLNRFS